MQKVTFGDTDLIAKKKRQAHKAEKPTTPPAPEKCCVFQTTIETSGRLMKSERCKEPALPNGWCEEHQHAQRGMDIGERLGWQGVNVPMTAEFRDNGINPFTLTIGPGKMDWLAYFERAAGTGLATVMKYLEKLNVERG